MPTDCAPPMKNQYFGDRRDLFKFDLLLDLAECVAERRLTFVPMLTPNDATGEGRLTSYDCGARRRVLFDALRQTVDSRTRNITSLRGVLPRFGVEYLPYRDAQYFRHGARREYFNALPG